jgi:hypothetical protein
MSDTEVAEATTEIPLPGLPGEVRLPSGGWAQLKPFSAATGADVKRVRRALNADGTGDILGGAFAAGIGVVVVEWQIPGQSMLQLPFNNPAVLDRLPADDLLALEDTVRPWVLRILGHEKKAGEADPS